MQAPPPGHGPPGQVPQLLDILARTLGAPAAAGQDAADLAASAPRVTPGPAAANDARAEATGDRMLRAVVATGDDERARRLRGALRRLATAGAPGSGMAPFRDKASLLELLLELRGASVPGAPALPDSRVDVPTAADGGEAASTRDTHPPPARSAVASAGAAAVPPRPSATRPPPAPLPAPRAALAAAGVLPPAADSTLARDALFLLQGIDGSHARFVADGDASGGGEHVECAVTVDGVPLPACARARLAAAGEAGWLYRRLAAALDAGGGGGGGGFVRRAFHAALRDEADDYFKQLAALSEHTQLAAAAPSRGAPWSLRRVAEWAAEPTQRLRALTAAADACAGLRGGALLGALERYARSGDLAAAAAAARVLSKAAAPFLAAALLWCASGDLPDGCAVAPDAGAGGEDGPPDFFVVADASVPPSRAWADRFSLLPSGVPSFLPPALAAAVLDVGRAVYFAREACGDGAWVAAHVGPAVRAAAAAASATTTVAATVLVAAPGAPGDDIAASSLERLVSAEHAVRAAVDGADATGRRVLERVVAAVAPAVHGRLARQLLTAHRLRTHVTAMHRYLLLSAGDFASALLPALAPLLDGPGAALALAGRSLDAVLDGALRSSNAQREDRDVLARLSVAVLAPSPGDAGWDVFTLSYAVGPPLTAVVTPAAAAAYARLFLFLARVKRAQGALDASWTAGQSGAHGVRGLRHGGLDRVLHACALVRADMHSLVGTLASYLGLDVLAAGAAALDAALGAAAGVSDLVSAHDAYLSTLLERCFLTSKTRGVGGPLRRLLDDVLRFADVLGRLAAAAAAQAEAWRAHTAAVAARGAQGRWGVPAGADDDDAVADRVAAALDDAVSTFGPDVADILASYKEGIADLLAAMDALAGTEGLEELRMLVFRFDFNSFYGTQ